MKLWEIQEILDQVKPFAEPKIELEQYPTDSHLAASLVFTAESTFNDIEGKDILDLGCGCGILSIATILMNSSTNTAIDIDQDAIEIFKQNINDIFEDEIPEINLVTGDIFKYEFKRTFDTVILNPPFGTKDNNGIDIKFIEKAIELSHNSVYSMHKSSTRQFIESKLTNNKRVKRFKVLAQMKFKISKIYKFHKKQEVFVEVDLIRVEVHNKA